MAALTLDVSDIEIISDQVVKEMGLNVLDISNMGDSSIEVIPSYLDRIYIGDVAHFIIILSVE